MKKCSDSKLEEFALFFDRFEMSHAELDANLKTIEREFNSSVCLQVSAVLIHGLYRTYAVFILKAFEAETLENLDLIVIDMFDGSRYQDMHELTQLEQWKKAKHLTTAIDVIEIPTEDLVGFSRLEFMWPSRPDAVRIREFFNVTRKLESCVFTASDADPDSFLREFEPKFVGSNKHIIYKANEFNYDISIDHEEAKIERNVD